MKNLELYKAQILAANRIVITTHLHPDADGIGSQVALALALRSLGKKVVCVNEKKVDKRYSYLVPEGLLLSFDEYHKEHKNREIDLFVVVDTSSLTRVGPSIEGLLMKAKNLLFIDHHPCPKELMAIHCIDPERAATAEIIGILIDAFQVTLTKEMALALYTAVLIDTSSFRYPSVTSHTHRFIATLRDAGVDGSEAYTLIYGTKKVAHMQLLGAVLSNVATTPDGKIAWLSLSESLMKKYKAKAEDTNAFVNHLLVLDDVQVACMFREAGTSVKISLRSNGLLDVGLLGQALGGGGHNHSAATVVEGDLDEVIKNTIEKISRILKEKKS